jgi:hypothetical protein
MDGKDSFEALESHNDFFLHNQIYAVTAAKLDAFILHRQFDLTSEADSAKVEFVTQTLFVRRFQESRPKDAMHLNGSTND